MFTRSKPDFHKVVGSQGPGAFNLQSLFEKAYMETLWNRVKITWKKTINKGYQCTEAMAPFRSVFCES